MPSDPAKFLVEYLLRDERLKEKVISARALEIVASEQQLSLDELNTRLWRGSMADDPTSEELRLMKLVQDKYQELERAGYPLIAFDDNPNPYYCHYGAAIGSGPSPSAASSSAAVVAPNPVLSPTTRVANTHDGGPNDALVLGDQQP